MSDESAGQGAQWSELRSGFIDEACARFETAWQAGQQPQIEDFLPAESLDKSGAMRFNLLAQLLGIDLEWRWKTADMPAKTQTVAKKPSPPALLPQMVEGSPAASGSSVSLPPRPRLADYVVRYALLGPLEQLPRDLIVAEYYARRRYGDQPTHAEYLDAFGRVIRTWRNSFRQSTMEWLLRNIFPPTLSPTMVRPWAAWCSTSATMCC